MRRFEVFNQLEQFHNHTRIVQIVLYIITLLFLFFNDRISTWIFNFLQLFIKFVEPNSFALKAVCVIAILTFLLIRIIFSIIGMLKYFLLDK